MPATFNEKGVTKKPKAKSPPRRKYFRVAELPKKVVPVEEEPSEFGESRRQS